MAIKPMFKPAECPHCEYDRRFPDFERGGWMQQDNNGPIVSCPMCNDDGSYPRSPQEPETAK
jgi:hypothetical protein